jgi:hypothetical protein
MPGSRRTSACSPAGRADELGVGELARDRGDQGVAPAAVQPPGPAQVAVDVAALEQVGQGELLEHRAAAVGGDALPRHRAGEPLGQDEPPEPQPVGQRLARRPGVGDAVGIDALQRAHRLAVEAVLGVVVVLDDQAVDRLGPGRAARRAARARAPRRWASGAPG